MMEKKPGYIIEEGRRLSKSTLWDLSRAFYDRMGIAAWSSGKIPSYVTNNPFIANGYGQQILGFIRDCRAGKRFDDAAAAGLLDSSQPIFIVELGAGSGRLGYLMVKKLLALKRAALLDGVDFCYVMSDAAESNIQFWNDHPALQPFLEEGMLDFALFDPETEQEIRLARSGILLSSETIRNPLIILANYLFDALSQDSFRVEKGTLFEGLYTLTCDQERELTDPILLEQLAISSEYRPVETDYYDDPRLNQILDDYRRRLVDSSLLFPLGALRTVRNLVSLSRGRLLILAADKGYVNEEQILERDPSLEVEGMRSMTGMAVNCHALRQYFHQLGGQVLHSFPWDTRLVISAFFAGVDPSGYAETRAAFAEAIDQFSPFHYYVMVREGGNEGEGLEIEKILALLRLSHWDPQILLWHATGLREQLETASRSMKEELSHAMSQLWDNYYAIGEKEDLAFEIGTLFQKMKQPAEALSFYEKSRQLSGTHHATEFNRGLCHYQLGEINNALGCINRALELRPDYQPAKEWKAYLESHG